MREVYHYYKEICLSQMCIFLLEELGYKDQKHYQNLIALTQGISVGLTRATGGENTLLAASSRMHFRGPH